MNDGFGQQKKLKDEARAAILAFEEAQEFSVVSSRGALLANLLEEALERLDIAEEALVIVKRYADERRGTMGLSDTVEPALRRLRSLR